MGLVPEISDVWDNYGWKQREGKVRSYFVHMLRERTQQREGRLKILEKETPDGSPGGGGRTREGMVSHRRQTDRHLFLGNR